MPRAISSFRKFQLQNPRIRSSAEHGFPAGFVDTLGFVLARQARISLVVGG
jgi:hypothetical protein